jgi:hypothetical protein
MLSTTPWRRVGEWRYRNIILDPSTRWRWVVSFTSLPPYLRYPFYRKLGGPQNPSGRYGREKHLLPLSRNRTLIVQPVAQSLYRLSYPGSSVFQDPILSSCRSLFRWSHGFHVGATEVDDVWRMTSSNMASIPSWMKICHLGGWRDDTNNQAISVTVSCLRAEKSLKERNKINHWHFRTWLTNVTLTHRCQFARHFMKFGNFRTEELVWELYPGLRIISKRTRRREKERFNYSGLLSCARKSC